MVWLNKLSINTRLTTFFALTALTLSGCGGGSASDAEKQNTKERTEPYVHHGSVGDGPIKNATITFRGPNGVLISSLISGDTAIYTAEMPPLTEYPVTISADGGIDLVSGEEPSFVLVTAALTGEQETANINPFTTLIVKGAQRMPGGVSRQNVNTMIRHITTHLNFGLDIDAIPDPISTKITPVNIASIIKASEALGELIRRTQLVMQYARIDVTQNEVMSIVAADMVDGILDGQGASGSEPMVAAIANILSAQIAVEVLSNNMRVNWQVAMESMDEAIHITMPDAPGLISVSDVPLTTQLLTQARTTVGAALALSSSLDINKVFTVVKELSPGDSPRNTTNIASNIMAQFEDLALLVASSGTTSEWALINDIVRANSASANGFLPAEAINIHGALASDYLDQDHAADRAIDGADWSYWVSYGMPASLSLDLGSTQSIDNVLISFLNYNQGRLYDYSIAVSTDNVNWTDVVLNQSSGSEKWTANPISATSARWVKVTVNGANDSNWVGIYEIRVIAANSDASGSSSPAPNSDTNNAPPANVTPIARDDSLNISENTAGTVNLLANDLGLTNNPITVEVFSAPSNGEAVIDAQGRLTYTPAQNFTGWDSLTYQITDADGDISSATVFIRVLCQSCTNGDIELTLSWSPNPDVVDGYLVFYGPTADSAVIPLSIISITDPNFVPLAPEITFSMQKDLFLNQGDSVCFRLRAFRVLAESGLSEAICTTL